MEQKVETSLQKKCLSVLPNNKQSREEWRSMRADKEACVLTAMLAIILNVNVTP